MKVLLFGPQGSGKSTQGKLLAKYLDIPYVSTGDIFRSISDEQSEIGIKVKQILSSGKLVDDATTSDLVKQKLAGKQFAKGFVMDGYPRTIEQVQRFDPNFNIVIYLDVPHAELLKRLLDRGREDDTKEAIEARLHHYYSLTEPLLDYYQNKGILHKLDGIGEVDLIQDKVLKVITGI